ncbi:hypothetical protein F7725_025271 [Dissostichus mawsoni]|uniref:UBA domain-containing protein n=1 Tax=Dissostichus mawsoni TaxID=36200 RepID=A0A7J5XBT9_DISMA|nr:hypothetical protein F7725_025271 [Dissostichus mawsoni]
MMTSMGGNRARGSWDQTQGQTQSQTQHKQRPQATAEQIRLAQMISDHNDADFEEKVKQLIDITGKDQDESMIALHDCNGDVNRAINVLLEGSPDTDSWEMVGKKKGVSGQKETSQAEIGEEGKENREKGGEKDAARRRGGAPRRARGASRGREFRGQENGLEGAKAGVVGRGAERGRRGRGREEGLSGYLDGGEADFRRRAWARLIRGPDMILQAVRALFIALFRSTFNPADYAEPAQTDENYGGGSTWNNTGSGELEEEARSEYAPAEGTNFPPKFDSAPGAWRAATEEWGTEDWNEDLSETKIFTASSVASVPPPQENVTITKGQSAPGQDSPVLLLRDRKPPMEAAQPSSLSQSMVFSNSKQGVPLSQTSSSTSYTQHSMVSMLSKSFGEVGDPKGASTGTTGSQFLEQYKTAQALAQLAAQHSQTGPPNTTHSSWDTSGPSLGQYDMKTQPEQGPFALHKAAALPDRHLVHVGCFPAGQRPASFLLVVSLAPRGASASFLPSQNGSNSFSRSASFPEFLRCPWFKSSAFAPTQTQTAEEEDFHLNKDMSGLNLQFGAFQFGSEPAMPEYESTPASTTQVHQVQNSLYTSPSRSNGFSSIHGTHSGEAGSAVSVRQVSDSVTPVSMGTLTDSGSGPASLMTSSNQTSLSGLGHSEDMPPNTFPPPQHSNSHQSQQNSLAQSSVRSSNSILMHPSVDGDSSLHCSNYPSSVSSVPSSVPSSSSAQVSLGVHQVCSVGSNTVLAPSGLCPISSLAMGLNPASMAVQAAVAAASMSSAGSTIPSLATSSSSRNSAASSGKAPPNLPPGVPPLLPNPYIMAPGLLHAYPPQVYGYDDLQMLQARIPLDYYSIAPFATPTAALTGRDGNLTNNPYSGDLSKFGRGDASSPSPATTLAQTQQNQTQAHHTAQQPFLNPALPPGYSYTSLPYYTGMPGLPNTFQYGPAVFPVAPTSSKQHGVNVGVNASAAPFQQASGYGSHGYSTGYEDVGQASGSGDFCKGGYGTAAAASAQNKPASSVSGPGVGVSVTSSNTGVPDISGSVYTKTQSFDKQGFHAGTPAASFSLPSALGSGGPINPPAATAYAPAPFMHILAPHQQPHSQILHHHLQQDGQSGTGQRSQNASLQQKSQINKSAYNTYNWGAN